MQGKIERLEYKFSKICRQVFLIALLSLTCCGPASVRAEDGKGSESPSPELRGMDDASPALRGFQDPPVQSDGSTGPANLKEKKPSKEKKKKERAEKAEKAPRKEKREKPEKTAKQNRGAEKGKSDGSVNGGAHGDSAASHEGGALSTSKKAGKKLKLFGGGDKEDRSADKAQGDSNPVGGADGGGNKDKNDRSPASGNKASKRRGNESELNTKAREALNGFYGGGLLPLESYIKDIKSGDAKQARGAVQFIEALLQQAMDDEANGSNRSVSPAPFVTRPLTSTAIEARGAIHGAIFRVGPSIHSLGLLDRLTDDMLPSADGAAALIVTEISGPDAVAFYTKLLNRPGSSGLTTAAVLRKIGKDKLQQFAPKVKEFSGHYRTAVRQAAIEAAGALGITDIPAYSMQNSVTPWLASQIAEIGKIKDEQDKIADLTNAPATNPTVAAAFEYLHGDKTKGLNAILEKINGIPDDRLLLLQTRDDVFIDYYKFAVQLFREGKFKDTERVAKFLASPVFSDSSMIGAPKHLLAQFSDRSADFQSFSLPSESSWQEMQKRLPIKEQIEFLAPRLRLVKGQSEKRVYLGDAVAVNLDAKQSDPVSGNSVINPLVELRKLTYDPANLPFLFPYISDRHYLLAAFESPGALPRLQSVGDTVKILINEALQYQMLGSAFAAMSPGEQQAFLAKQEKWCRKNAKLSGLDLSFAIADSTDDEKAFSHHVFRLQQAGDSRLSTLLNKRWTDFPSNIERNAEFLFRSGGALAVKRAEEELKKAPPSVSHRTPETPSQWAAAERPAATRFWLALLLVNENNPLGLAEFERTSLLPAEQISFVLRDHLSLLVEVLLLDKSPEKLGLADKFVDKLNRFAPGSEQVVESTKRLFLAGSKASYDRILAWINSEPMPAATVEKLVQWVYAQPNKHYSASDLKDLSADLKTKLQAEFDLRSAGKPGTLTMSSGLEKPITPDPLKK